MNSLHKTSLKSYINRPLGLFLYLFILLVSSFQMKAWAHGDGESRVAIEPAVVGPVKAGTLSYEFQLVDTKLKKMITPENLQVVHEKLIHLFIFDSALREFHHVHPEFNAQRESWVTDVQIPVNGKYWVWAQGTLNIDGEEFSAAENMEIFGGQNAWPLPEKLNDYRSNRDGISIAELSLEKIRAEKMVMLNLNFKRTDGSTPKITPYLGEIAHLVAVTKDGDSLIHVHPMAGHGSNMGMIHAVFPFAGEYRVWIQFVDEGVLRTVPLSLVVGK